MTSTTESPTTRTVEFFFDPSCPFCWQTSKWFRQVARQVDIDPVWRFISLAVLNDELDQVDQEDGHAVGHKFLRVAAAAQQADGPEVVGPLYEEMGRRLWETAPEVAGPLEGSAVWEAIGPHQASVLGQLTDILDTVGLSTDLAAAATDPQHDAELTASTEEAMERTGGDVGTPILAFGGSGGAAFFGPVISSTPSDEDAVKLWDAVATLATWPSFAELKRSLRSPLDNHLLNALTGR
jgi:hypothetical protein